MTTPRLLASSSGIILILAVCASSAKADAIGYPRELECPDSTRLIRDHRGERCLPWVCFGQEESECWDGTVCRRVCACLEEQHVRDAFGRDDNDRVEEIGHGLCAPGASCSRGSPSVATYCVPERVQEVAQPVTPTSPVAAARPSGTAPADPDIPPDHRSRRGGGCAGCATSGRSTGASFVWLFASAMLAFTRGAVS